MKHTYLLTTALFVTLSFVIGGVRFSMYAADSTPIIINELMADPEGSDGDFEWIELYNFSNDLVDLSDWDIDGVGMPEGTRMLPHTFLIIAKDVEKIHERYGPDETLLIVEASISLRNGGEITELRNSNGDLIDSFAYEGSQTNISWERKGNVQSKDCLAPVAHTEQDSFGEPNQNASSDCTVEDDATQIVPEIFRITFSSETIADETIVNARGPISLSASYSKNFSDSEIVGEAWFLEDGSQIEDPDSFTLENYLDKSISVEVELKDGTVLSKKSEKLQILSSATQLHISEVYPSPNPGESEWVELYNFGDTVVHLQDFYVTDKANTTNMRFEENEILNPGEYKSFEATSLNNSDEELFLYRWDDTLIDTVWYAKVEKGLSAVRPDQQFNGDPLELVQTQNPTRNTENILIIDAEESDEEAQKENKSATNTNTQASSVNGAGVRTQTFVPPKTLEEVNLETLAMIQLDNKDQTQSLALQQYLAKILFAVGGGGTVLYFIVFTEVGRALVKKFRTALREGSRDGRGVFFKKFGADSAYVG